MLHSIAAIGTEESLAVLRRAAGYLSEWKRVHAVYEAALVYSGELESEAIRWVAGEVTRAKEDIHMLASARALAAFKDRAFEEQEHVFARHRDRRVQEIVFQPLIARRAEEGTPKAVESILEFADLREPESRETALAALESCTSTKVNKLLLRRLGARDTSLLEREALLITLAERAGADIDKALIKALDDSDLVLQLRVMEALAARGVASATRKLEKFLSSESRVAAREALISLDRIEQDREDWELQLLKHARSKHPGVRMGAAAALGGVPGDEATHALHELFEDPVWAVRAEAYESTRKRAAPESMPALEARIDSEHGRLRADLIQILNELGGQGAPAMPSTDSNGTPWPQFFGIACETQRLCILVDRSSSMGNEMQSSPWSGKTRLAAVAQELEGYIQALAGGSYLAMLYQDSELHSADMEGSKAKSSVMIEFAQSMRPGSGGMDLFAAINEGLTSGADTIVIVADGDPTLGSVIDPALLVQRIGQRHRESKVRIHGVALGRELPLLQNLAAATGGQYLSQR